MYIKVHQTQKGRIVAACDRELIGRILKEGEAVLDLKTYGGFYQGMLSDSETLSAELERFTSANLVGKKAVGVALDSGLAEEEDIKYINSVPYVQLYKL